MTNHNFKTAAAKLLAQHSTKLPENKESSTNIGSPAIHPKKGAIRGILLSLVQQPLILGLALTGCVIMVLMVPELIFGIWFNALLGIIIGVVFGIIIMNEL